MSAFTVYGTPRPQGSKRHVGGGVMIEANKHTKSWRGAVAQVAAASGAKFTTDPVAMRLIFYFARPRGHYGTGKRAGTLKASAPRWPTSKQLGDLDKLLRATCDALTGVVYKDDSQVVSVEAQRRYGEPERLEVTITHLEARA